MRPSGPGLGPGHRFAFSRGHSFGPWCGKRLRERRLRQLSVAGRSPAMTRQAIRPMPRPPLGKPARVTPAPPRRATNPAERPMRPLQLPPLPADRPTPAPAQLPSPAPGPATDRTGLPTLLRRETIQRRYDLDDTEFTALISAGLLAEVRVAAALPRYRACDVAALVEENAEMTS